MSCWRSKEIILNSARAVALWPRSSVVSWGALGPRVASNCLITGISGIPSSSSGVGRCHHWSKVSDPETKWGASRLLPTDGTGSISLEDAALAIALTPSNIPASGSAGRFTQILTFANPISPLPLSAEWREIRLRIPVLAANLVKWALRRGFPANSKTTKQQQFEPSAEGSTADSRALKGGFHGWSYNTNTSALQTYWTSREEINMPNHQSRKVTLKAS